MDKHVSEWVGKCINDMTPAQADAAKANILRIDDRLSVIYQGCTERAVKALFFVNSGGVISILTYLYQDQGRKMINSPDLKYALVTFLVGLGFVFIGVVAIDYFLCFYRSQSFGKQVKKFIDNKITFFDIHEFKKPGLKWFDWLIVGSGVISGLCAVGGTMWGLMGYLTYFFILCR